MWYGKLTFAVILGIALSTAGNSRAKGAPAVTVNDESVFYGGDAFTTCDLPWRFVFRPSGRLWVWQSDVRDLIVTWDYGAKILMEIAHGRGHRLWFGGDYRMAAGYRAEQSIIPFDPSQIDNFQIFSWRWAFRPRHIVSVHFRRSCYHVIDLHNRAATTWTLMAIGFGTLSPAEMGEGPIRVRNVGKPLIDIYISAGPFLQGGKSRFYGNAPTYQGEATIFLAYTVPVTRTLLIEASTRWDYLRLIESNPKPDRYRAYVRLTVLAQRDSGGASIFVDRNLHDDYIERWHPVAWRFGLEHRF